MKERSFKRVFAMLLAIVLIFGDAVILPKQNNDAEAATCNHSYSWVDVVPATCTKEGRRDYMCSKCKNVAQSATLPKVPNHSLVYQYKVSPTCTAKGYDVYKCSECGTVVNQNYKDATGHNYSWVTAVEPHCNSEGRRDNKCTNCGHVCNSATLEKVPDHDWKFQYSQSRSCTQAGYDEYKCSRCGATEKRNYQEATGHNYSWVEVVKPHCNSVGRRDNKCSNCGHVCDSATLEKVPDHIWNFTKHVKGDCTHDDYDLYTCSRCGATEQRNVTKAAGHKYSWVIAVEPHCNSVGRRDNKCSNCGHVCDSATLEKVPDHIWNFTKHVKGDCTHDDYDLYTCSRCGATEQRNVTKATGHNYTWVTIVEANCIKEGRRDNKCSVCGHVCDSATLPKVPDHDMTVEKVEPTLTTDGYEKKYCKRCSYVEYNKVIPMLGTPCAVTFNSQCSSANTTATYIQGQKFDSLPSVTYAGHTFNGWYTAATGGTKVTTSTTVPAKSKLTLYAHWTAKTYKVTYDVNGGTNVPATQVKTYGVPVTLASTKPTRTGYTFVGWGTSATATTATYKPGDTYTKNANITLYAVWKIKTYKIIYNANSGTGAPDAQTKNYGTSITLSTVKPKKTGYDFVGWGTSAGATEVAYKPGATYKRNANITLYAIWKLKEITITFDANGGTGAPDPMKTQYNAEIIISGKKPSRVGYTFKGWSKSAKATEGTYQPATNCRFTSNVTLYAVWTRKTYKVTYNANGGSNAPATQIKTYDVDLTLSTEVPTKKGYTFAGWGTSEDATAVAYKSGATYKTNANITLYAIWKINKITVKFDMNGGTGTIDPIKATYNAKITIPATKPVRTGYTFLGWSSDKNATTATYKPSVTYTFTNTTMLYAVWRIKTYTITYNANGGSNPPQGQTKTYGVALKLTTAVPTRKGYTFLGWGISADQTDVSYASGATYGKNASKTLYAIWKLNKVNVVYIANGGNGNTIPSSHKIDVEKNRTLSLTIPSRKNYTFVGWNTKKNGSGDFYNPGQDASVLCTKDGTTLNLYAIWRTNVINSSDGGFNYTFTDYVAPGTSEIKIDIPKEFLGYYKLLINSNNSYLTYEIFDDANMLQYDFEAPFVFDNTYYYYLSTDTYSYKIVIKNSSDKVQKANATIHSNDYSKTGLNGDTSFVWKSYDIFYGEVWQVYICEKDLETFLTVNSYKNAVFEVDKSFWKFVRSKIKDELYSYAVDKTTELLAGGIPLLNISYTAIKKAFEFFDEYQEYDASIWSPFDWLTDRMHVSIKVDGIDIDYIYHLITSNSIEFLSNVSNTKYITSELPVSENKNLAKIIRNNDGIFAIGFKDYNVNYGAKFTIYYNPSGKSSLALERINKIESWDGKSMKIRPGTIGELSTFKHFDILPSASCDDLTWMLACGALNKCRKLYPYKIGANYFYDYDQCINTGKYY